MRTFLNLQQLAGERRRQFLSPGQMHYAINLGGTGQTEDPLAEPQTESHLRQGAITVADRDQAGARLGDDGVARLADAGRDRHGDERVGLGWVTVRQQADGYAADRG